MVNKKLYSIGEAAKIANISNKTLRYYERIGLIEPDEINEKNGYRYYSLEKLQNLSIIKYYKQMGYTLSEIKEMKDDKKDDFNEIIINFQEKIKELQKKEKEIQNSLKAINDWYKLIKESKIVMNLNSTNVNIKYIERQRFLYKDFDFYYDYRTKILNIEWVKYLEKIENEISGPVIFRFDNFYEKMKGNANSVRIIQKPVKEAENSQIYEIEGGFFLSTYHIGDFKDINKAYQRIIEFAEKNGMELYKISFERFITDYWTTNNSDDYVVEILVKIKNKDLF